LIQERDRRLKRKLDDVGVKKKSRKKILQEEARQKWEIARQEVRKVKQKVVVIKRKLQKEKKIPHGGKRQKLTSHEVEEDRGKLNGNVEQIVADIIPEIIPVGNISTGQLSQQELLIYRLAFADYRGQKVALVGTPKDKRRRFKYATVDGRRVLHRCEIVIDEVVNELIVYQDFVAQKRPPDKV
jgi:hypothetical protein